MKNPSDYARELLDAFGGDRMDAYNAFVSGLANPAPGMRSPTWVAAVVMNLFAAPAQ